MTRKTVYVETSVVSYATGRPFRDEAAAANQRATWAWWNGASHRFELVASEVVVREAKEGDPEAADRRLEALRRTRLLERTPESEKLRAALLNAGALPPGEGNDAEHIAIAAVHGVDYLVTWNFRHILNEAMLPLIGRICRELGYEPPQILTPAGLMDDRAPADIVEVKEAHVEYMAEFNLNVEAKFDHLWQTEAQHIWRGGAAMRPTVYLETTVVTYLTTEPAPSERVAVDRLATRNWWEGPAVRLNLVASRGVVDEALKGDPETVLMRLQALKAVTLIDPTPESERLTDALLDAGAVARHARGAAEHIALATTYGAGFLATWNYRDIYNGEMMPLMKQVCRDLGYERPFLVTTDCLWGGDYPISPIMAEVYAAKRAATAKRRRARARAERRRRADGKAEREPAAPPEPSTPAPSRRTTSTV